MSQGGTPQQALNKPERNPDGTLKKGSTANPGGRPRDPEWLADRSLKALEYIADVADGTEEGVDHALRLKAAQILVERHFGKPKEKVEVSGEVKHVESRTVVLVRAQPSEKVVTATLVPPPAIKGTLDAE